MQGVQEQLTGVGRHGDLQGGVSRPLLPGAAASALGLQHGPDHVVGAGRDDGSGISQSIAARARVGEALKTAAGFTTERETPAFRGKLSKLVSAPA